MQALTEPSRPTGSGKQRLLCAAMLLLTIGPLWLVTRDLFDGASIAYADLIGNTDGIYQWAANVNWQLAIYFYKAVFAVSAALQVPYWVIVKTILTLCMLSLVYEFKRLATDVFNLDDAQAWLLALLCLASPSLYMLVSSSITPIFFCVWLAFVGHRLFWSVRVPIRLLGLAMMVVS